MDDGISHSPFGLVAEYQELRAIVISGKQLPAFTTRKEFSLSHNDYDDPDVEEGWVDARRIEVSKYLASQNVIHGEIGDWPAWHVAPITSIWAIESKMAAGSVGWWAICGDHPTDYVSAKGIKHPRAALRSFCIRWEELGSHMQNDKAHPTVKIGNRADWSELAQLLLPRIEMFQNWATDDTVWDYDEAEFNDG